MSHSLKDEFSQYKDLSIEGASFLADLEKTIAQDLWQSAGGHWSLESTKNFRKLAMQKLAAEVQGPSRSDFQSAWISVIRDFHKNQWGEQRLLKKEKKPETKEDKIFWELFSYIWILLQATLVTKTAVFYFGIKSAEEDTTEGRIYVLLAIAFSFISLGVFAYRKSKKKKDPKDDGSSSAM
ncbi:hypothetical protein AZI87_02745 [Bdellovibrio bacteriovorus]|uniref:Uncharacterized protein n=1 Tax=Bdellovibrio bacteriovorus TaxID=959 RepID=A0A162GHX5_BDEBC|nr:hypothetical protein [Bdellovibrio bacteriovorus]KYG68191.1 hypothetical protein AZI87_02745 [Bdellovibrio bacteriovorus]